MTNRWYIFAVLACWGAAMGWLFVEKILPTLQQGDPPEYAEVLPETDNGPRRTCWEIHYQDRPIGQATSWAVRNEDGSGKLESVVQFERLPLSELISELLGTFGALVKPMWNTDDNIEIAMNVVSEMFVGADGKLDSFVTELRIDDLDNLIRVEGEVNGNKLDLAVLTSDDGRSMHVRYRDQIDLSSEAVVSGALSPQDRLANLHVGQTWTLPVYRPFPPNSPLQMVQAKVERTESFAWNNESLAAFEVFYRADAGSGISISREPIGKMWVAEDGAVLQQEARIANMQFRFVRLPDDACAVARAGRANRRP